MDAVIAGDISDQEEVTEPMPHDATEVESTEVDYNEIREDGPAVADQIRKWIDEARVPSWMTQAYTRWKKDQDYLHTELFADGSPNVISINLAARLIQSKLASILPTDSDVSIKQERPVADAATVRRDAIREAHGMLAASGALQADPAGSAMQMIAAADASEQDFKLEQEAHERFAATYEALIKKLHDEADGTVKERTAGLCAFTTGIAWVKLGWQEDYGRDSVGSSRNDDAQDQIALLALRAAEYQAGYFGESDPQFDELRHLTTYAREQGRQVLAGQADSMGLPMSQWAKLADSRDGEVAPADWLPEPDRWQGSTIDNVLPWNMRWDWRVPFFKFTESDWTMEQVPMDLDTLAAEYHLTPAEKAAITSFNTENQSGTGKNASINKESANPDNIDYESNIQRGKVILWDRWEKKTRRHVVFVEGLDRYLIDEVPTVVTPWFYPYAELGFNELDGAHIPPSEVRFIRKICDSINQRLTDANESLWASMKRYLVKKNAFKEGEIQKLKGSTPHDVIEMESPEEIKASWVEIASDDWNPEKYKLDDLFRLLELTMGMSLAQLGVVDVANTATEASIAESRSQQQSARHGLLMAEFIQKIFTGILHMAATCMSQDTVKSLVGSAAFCPAPPTRLDLLRGMKVKVDAAGSKQQGRQREAEDLQRIIASINSIFMLKQQAMAVGMNLDLQPLISRALRSGDVDASYRDLFGSAKSPDIAQMQQQAPQQNPPKDGQGMATPQPRTVAGSNLPPAANATQPPRPPVQN